MKTFVLGLVVVAGIMSSCSPKAKEDNSFRTESEEVSGRDRWETGRSLYFEEFGRNGSLYH